MAAKELTSCFPKLHYWMQFKVKLPFLERVLTFSAGDPFRYILGPDNKGLMVLVGFIKYLKIFIQFKDCIYNYTSNSDHKEKK